MAVMDVMATRASKDIRVFMTNMAFLAIMAFMAIRAIRAIGAIRANQATRNFRAITTVSPVTLKYPQKMNTNHWIDDTNLIFLNFLNIFIYISPPPKKNSLLWLILSCANYL